MTKDEELKEAREWFANWFALQPKPLPSSYDEFAELLVTYHHHRLETDVDGFDLSQITAKQMLDVARKDCQKNKLPETPKETGK